MSDAFSELLCAILGDRPFVWPDADAAAARRLYEVARQHGVHRLVAHRLWQRGTLDSCPPTFRDLAKASLCNQFLIEEIARAELQGVLAALADAGVRPLLFKGAALAFTHYPDPALRPRVDADLLVDASETDAACATLERLGYRRPPFVSGELVMHQVPYSRTDRHGVPHTVDLHWKISNPQVFAGMLGREELLAGAVPIPSLGEGARAVGDVHALALACIHRVAHHSHEERLIWIYDIHLVAERLTAAEQEEFLGLAAARRLTSVCSHGLALAERRFQGRGAGLMRARLERLSRQQEPAEAYVSGAMRKVDVLLSDLAALEGWGTRLKLLREHLFPPRTYMRQVYGVASPALLPLLYAWRFARGAREWCRRPATRPEEKG